MVYSLFSGLLQARSCAGVTVVMRGMCPKEPAAQELDTSITDQQFKRIRPCFDTV
jgi:hypothetical protein